MIPKEPQLPGILDVIHRHRFSAAVACPGVSAAVEQRLLFLTEPTELYNSPTFGVGLKRYLFQYNNENTKAMMKDRMIDQLRLFEPCCDAAATEFADGLLFSGSNDTITSQPFNRLEMTVALKTVYGDTAKVDLTDLQEIIDHTNI